MCCEPHRPTAAADLASKLSGDDILQHRLVQAEVGDRALELAILILELAQAPHLGRHPPSVVFALIKVGHFADPRLSADLADSRAALGLLEHEGELRLRKLRPPHRLLHILALQS